MKGSKAFLEVHSLSCQQEDKGQRQEVRLSGTMCPHPGGPANDLIVIGGQYGFFFFPCTLRQVDCTPYDVLWAYASSVLS